MTQMTTHERVSHMFEHRDADRIPITDSPWDATVARWHREGMPKDVSFADYFDLDKFAMLWVDGSPRFEERVISESDTQKTTTTNWGVTLRQQKPVASTPEFLDFTIKDRDSWAKAKERITVSRDRVNWAQLRKDYPTWRREGRWLQAAVWFGFDVTHSWMVGTERFLMAMLEDPEWCVDMFRTELETSLALWDMVWDEGFRFDSIWWWDDMGYKNSQFFSVDTYREVLAPFHRQAIEWAHAKGIKAELHSCGDIRPFVPDLIDMGLDALNPLEVKAGVEPRRFKADHGDKLVLHGGLNAVLWEEPEKLHEEMRRVIPALKQSGGYICSTDHSVPANVSLEDFRQFTALAKELGAY